MLQKMGLQVQIANNGNEAVEAFRNRRFSVILMDCQMPEMDGFDATKAIRKLETLAGTYTPIIAVTALAMSGDQERCIAAGMDDYLSKPVDTNLLKLKLNHWLQADVVHQSHKLVRRFGRDSHNVDPHPIDLSELEEFFTEEQLEETLNLFVSQMENMIKRTNFFINEHDAKAVAGLSHEMRASCASIGAKALARSFLYLEQSAGLEDWSESGDTMKSIEAAFDNLRQFIKRTLAGERQNKN